MSTPANWSGDTLPLAGDTIQFDATSNGKDAILDAGFVQEQVAKLLTTAGFTRTLTLSKNLAVTVLDLNGGTVTGAGELTLLAGGNSIWGAGGTMAGTGVTRISAGATLVISTSNPHVVDGRFIQNSGRVEWTDGNIVLNNNAVFFNELRFIDSTPANPGDRTIDTTTPQAPGIFYSDTNGTFEKTSTSRSFVDAEFYSVGSVEVQGGNLVLGGKSTNKGQVNLAGGNLTFAAVMVGAGHTLDGASIIGPGQARLINGSLSIVNQVSAARFTLTDQGILTGTGTLTTTNTFLADSGSMTGTGSTVIAPGANAFINGDVTVARSFTNNGTLLWSNGNITLDQGAVLANNLVMRIEGGPNFVMRDETPFPLPAAKFNNTGSLLITQAVRSIWVGFTNTGTVTFSVGGDISFSRDYVQTAGTTILDGGILRTNGRVENGPAGTIRAVANNSTIIAALGVENSGLVEMAGDGAVRLAIQGAYTQSASGRFKARLIGVTFDQLDVAGTVTMGGTLEVAFVGIPPAVATNYTIMKYGSKVGTFTTVTKPPNTTWDPQNTEGYIRFQPPPPDDEEAV